MNSMPIKAKKATEEITHKGEAMTKHMVTTEGNLPATKDEELERALLQGNGEGTSSDAADNQIPYITLLQAQSPQVMKGNPARIEGAEPGDLWLKNAPTPIVKGETGFLFQPCYMYRELVEWKPERGGFVARHDMSCAPLDSKGRIDPNGRWKGTLEGVKAVSDKDKEGRWEYLRDNNNNIVDTRYWVGIVHHEGLRLPYIIPLSSTGHSFAISLNTSIRGLINSKIVGAAYAVFYQLRTQFNSNADGSWYQYTTGPMVRKANSLEELHTGKALYEAFVSGEKVAANPETEGHNHNTTFDNESPL